MSEEIIYKIPFVGLKNGIHEYEFSADQTFFLKFSESLLHKAKVRFNVELEKTTTLMNLNVHLSGYSDVNCDRCGDDISLKIEGSFMIVVKFGNETSDLIDDVIFLGPSEHHIELDQLFYEFSNLCLPSRILHEDEADCNQEALEALQKFSLKEKEQDIDPRWDQLKNLK